MRDLLAENLFDSSALGVAISGPDGRIVRTNPALDGILGYPEGELLGRELFRPDDVLTGPLRLERTVPARVPCFLDRASLDA